MNISKLKKKIAKSSIIAPFLVMATKANVFATTIGTQEVETATQNVKDAVIKLAMPVRFCSYVCEYCNNSNKINC